MSIDLSRLLGNLFFVEEEVTNASYPIECALQTVEQKFKAGARSFEIGSPTSPTSTGSASGWSTS